MGNEENAGFKADPIQIHEVDPTGQHSDLGEQTQPAARAGVSRDEYNALVTRVDTLEKELRDTAQSLGDGAGTTEDAVKALRDELDEAGILRPHPGQTDPATGQAVDSKE